MSFGNEIRVYAYLSANSNSWNCGSASSISFSRLMNAYGYVEQEIIKEWTGMQHLI